MVLGQVIAGSEFLKTLFATMEFRETLTVFSDTRVEQKIMAVNFRHFGVFSQLPVHAARVNCMGQLLNPPDQNVSWLSIMSYAREIVHVFFFNNVLQTNIFPRTPFIRFGFDQSCCLQTQVIALQNSFINTPNSVKK